MDGLYNLTEEKTEEKTTMVTITEVQNNVPLPTTARRGKPSTLWMPLFDSLKKAPDTRKILFTTDDPKDHDKLLNNARQAKMAYVKKHGAHLTYVIRVVRPNPELGDADVEKDGPGVRIWRGIDGPVNTQPALTAPEVPTDLVQE